MFNHEWKAVFEHTCAYVRWVHMFGCLSVRLSVTRHRVPTESYKSYLLF